MKTILSLGALALAATAATPAAALVVGTVDSNGNDVTVVESSGGLLAVDFGMNGFSNGQSNASASFALEEGEAGSTLDFNSLVDNFIGLNLGSVELELSGGAFFSGVGSVFPVFSGDFTSALSEDGTSFLVEFGGEGEPFGVEFGDVFGAGLENFQIDLSALGVGDEFALTVRAADTVPEPAAFALLGLGLLGVTVMRKKKVA